MDVPGDRKMHKTQVPNLGGLGLFIVFSLSIIIFGLLANLIQPDLIKLLSLIGATIILLFLGIKDDLMSISPKKKFVGQLFAVAIVVVLTDVRIISFDGLLGIGELPYFVSVLFSIFVFSLVINALNLVDGIDGLAGSMAVVSSASFGILFLINGQYMMTLISSVFVGSLVGFLRYNLSSDQKIFMGDCGSMLTGFLLAYQGIGFLALNEVASTSTSSNAPILLLAILSFPLFDTLRVFIVRVKQKRSPFRPDSNHIHHRLLRLGLNHKQATLSLSICNVLVIGLAFLVGDLNINLQLFIVVIAGSLLYLAPFLKVFEKNIDLNATKNRNDDDRVPIITIAGKIGANEAIEESIQPIKLVKDTSSDKELFFFSSNIQNEAAADNSSSFTNLKKEEKSLQAIENSGEQKILVKRSSEFKKLAKKHV